MIEQWLPIRQHFHALGCSGILAASGLHSRAPFHVSDTVYETVFVVLGECANGGH